jgi:hypothetical protein
MDSGLWSSISNDTWEHFGYVLGENGTCSTTNYCLTWQARRLG